MAWGEGGGQTGAELEVCMKDREKGVRVSVWSARPRSSKYEE